MKWRTDKPTANVIVALVQYNYDGAFGLQITDYDFRVLEKKADDFYIDFHSDREHIPTERITKWADLEEDEGTICPQKDETVTDIELIQKSWYRQGYIDGINKQEPQWILENLEYKENPKYGQPLETVTDYKDLADEIVRVSKRYPEVSFAKLSRIAKHFAKWGAEHLIAANKMIGDHIADESKKVELRNNSATTSQEQEEAAMQAYPSQEQVIVTAFGKLTIDKFKPERDAFIAGANWQREQMKEEAIEASCFGGKEGEECIVTFVVPYFRIKDHYTLGNKAKLYIFKDNKE